ncbi:MAG: hypothetical protein PHI34_11420 [Acidobacteriota bacterium]|nr:hypothetical protein [Acidobacteriota bacterium]
MKRHRLVVFFMFGLIAAAGWRLYGFQTERAIDPFYLNSLTEGEARFKAKSFGPAVVSLDIAAFGLTSRPADLGRVRLLLGLCHGYLGAREKIEPELKSAYALLGPDGIAKVDLPDWARKDLVKLLRSFNLGGSATAAEAKPPQAATVKQQAPVPAPPAAKAGTAPSPRDAGDKAAIEQAIRENPRQAAAYYRLASLHEEAGDRKSARRTYEDLLVKVPAEIRSCLEIGRLYYLDREYKNSEKWLERFLSLTAGVPTEARMTTAARAYLLLGAQAKGNGAKVRKLLQEKPALDRAAIETVALGSEDKTRLLRILGL